MALCDVFDLDPRAFYNCTVPPKWKQARLFPHTQGEHHFPEGETMPREIDQQEQYEYWTDAHADQLDQEYLDWDYSDQLNEDFLDDMGAY